MDIVITTPSLKNPHGGTRVLNEWALRLSKWHTVSLYVEDGHLKCDWYDIPRHINVTNSKQILRTADCLIIGSPHSIDLADEFPPYKKVIIFMQMLEHMFNPHNKRFVRQCSKFYVNPYTMIAISDWNVQFLRDRMKRKGKIHIVGNGVNFEHFPVSSLAKENIVLVEGWEATNAAKDTDAVGPRVAAELKNKGYTILAYSQKPITRYADVPDEYYCRPTLEQMNDLYSRAKILIKTTKYDCRSTAPMEAMTKGTVTVRGIIHGDDDLVHEVNSLKVDYDYNQVLAQAERILTDDVLYNKLSQACLEYVQLYTWDFWMERINNIINE